MQASQEQELEVVEIKKESREIQETTEAMEEKTMEVILEATPIEDDFLQATEEATGDETMKERQEATEATEEEEMIEKEEEEEEEEEAFCFRVQNAASGGKMLLPGAKCCFRDQHLACGSKMLFPGA